MLWMHQRPEGKHKDEILPLGNFINLEYDAAAQSLSGVPVFDDTDDFALKIFNKVENGTIRMTSAGLMPVTWKEVNGEKWLWESVLLEATICDRGSNGEALAQASVELYDEQLQPIALSDQYLKTVTNETISNMKTIELTEENLNMVNLKEGATPDEYAGAVQKTVNLAEERKERIVTLTAEKEAAETAKTEAEGKLAELKAEKDNENLVALVDKAEEEGKITKDERSIYLGDKENDIEALSFEKAEAILATKSPQKSVEETLKLTHKGKTIEVDFVKLTYKELEKIDGALVELKDKNFDLFNEKYKAQFGKDYQK